MSPAVKSIILRSQSITPDRLPGLAAWYSADYGVLTSISPDVAATDGQTVRRWLDRSGNARHLDQATLANQPTWSAAAKPYITFDGVSDFLAETASTISQPYTTICVIKRLTNAAGPRIFDGNTSGLDSGCVRIASGTTVTVRAGLTPTVNVNAYNNDEVIGIVWNGASTIVSTNGIADQTTSPGTTTPAGLVLAAQSGGAASFANVVYYEYIRCAGSVALTTIRRYLLNKYGLIV